MKETKDNTMTLFQTMTLLATVSLRYASATFAPYFGVIG